MTCGERDITLLLQRKETCRAVLLVHVFYIDKFMSSGIPVVASMIASSCWYKSDVLIVAGGRDWTNNLGCTGDGSGLPTDLERLRCGLRDVSMTY